MVALELTEVWVVKVVVMWRKSASWGLGNRSEQKELEDGMVLFNLGIPSSARQQPRTSCTAMRTHTPLGRLLADEMQGELR
jgi:hypothetical protein